MIYTEFVIRISLSMLLGFLIGLERQLTCHPAGIRINVLICIGTSFFMPYLRLCVPYLAAAHLHFSFGAGSHPFLSFTRQLHR